MKKPALAFTLALLLFSGLAAAQQNAGQTVDRELDSFLAFVQLTLFTVLFLILLAVFFLRAEQDKELPELKGRFFHPVILVLGLVAAIGLLAIAFLFPAYELGEGIKAKVFTIGALVAFFPLVVYLIYTLVANFYRKGYLHLIVVLLCWGVTAAGLTVLINTALGNALDNLLGVKLAAALTLVFLFPVIEETLKALGIFFLGREFRPNSIALGLLVGFTVGMGFAVFENWVYFTSNTSPFLTGMVGWVDIMVTRTYFTAAAHALFCGLVGAVVLGGNKILGGKFEYALAAAIVLHALYNLLALVLPHTFAQEFYVLVLFLVCLVLLFQRK